MQFYEITQQTDMSGYLYCWPTFRLFYGKQMKATL